MHIRKAETKDVPAIRDLLEQLGYPTQDGLVARRLEKLGISSEHCDVVCESGNNVVGFMSVHFIPQVAFDAEYAVISYLIVDDQKRSHGIGKALEEYATEIAVERGCRRIYLHSNARRVDAHRFYIRQDYEEYAKTFVKYLK
ncbi:MAG TPA: GNAT family N-acetyltransferase [Pedobacter sp.]|nr:GNAT family N-acetyltransferase [Pedobacter sp.]